MVAAIQNRGGSDMTRLLFTLLCLCTLPLHAEVSPPLVFVSIPPQKQLVERIAGDLVDVRVMLPPGQSPETFAPTPRQIVSLSTARVYFQVGVPFESSWTDSIRAVNPDIHIVECCDGLFANNAVPPDIAEDMHVWNDPVLVLQLAKQMLDELIILLPMQERIFVSNYRRLSYALNELDRDIRQRLLTRSTDYFIVSHGAWSLFAERYGLVQLPLEQNGKEIGARSLMELVSLARREKLDTVFVMEQYRTPFLANLAQQLDADLVELDVLAEDYIGNMYHITEKIARSLRPQ